MTATDVEVPAGAGGSAAQSSRRWWALIALLLASFMDLLDGTIVNVAIPSLQRNLGTSDSDAQWVASGYALAFALVLITGSRLGDIFGRKNLFMIGVAGFVLSSVLCGAAQGPEMLIVARVLQGAMAALMVPQVLSTLMATFPPRQGAMVAGMFGGVSGLAVVSGPMLGALLIKADLFGLEWRSIFLVNVPVGIIALIGAALYVQNTKSEHVQRVDIVGSLLVTAAMLLLVYPLLQGRDLGWPAWTYVSMAMSVPVLALFAFVQIRKGRANKSPLVEMSLFHKLSFNAGLLIGFLFFAGLIGFFFVFMMYLQIGRGFEVVHAGLTALPWSLGMAIGSAVSGAVLAPKLGRKLLSTGALVMCAAFVGLILTLHYEGINASSWQMLPSLVVAGLGMGAVVSSLFGIVLAAVEPREIGSASGLVNAITQVGASAGIAILGVVFFSLLGSQSTGIADRVTPQLRVEMSAVHVPSTVQDQVIATFRSCYHDRMVAKDPSQTPASCGGAKSGDGATAQVPDSVSKQMAAVFEHTGSRANGENFTLALQRTLWCAAGAMMLVFLLSFLLPARARKWG
ncbi:putative actinorhodin transporter [Streptomyces kronopolitis]|uniref:Actinorhodin transporter n=1 Tax=Streptomyces kronopolitis TaxID=1612435 RepID=A0ABQ2J2K7_9ACTN|nr:DHA2 family efflux MFS transporter permease subunit [Streptomyces kronopolitis]GGN36467.1 putative actinorhodin transporter [Streptomyces kronopolitis]